MAFAISEFFSFLLVVDRVQLKVLFVFDGEWLAHFSLCLIVCGWHILFCV